MNGRVYDPVLGRFLSADPNVDGVSDAQGYNRYSYVGNNPLGATDPTGYFSLKDALKIVAIVAAAVVGAMTGQLYLAGYIGQAAGAVSSTFGIFISKAVVMGIAGGLGGGFASGFTASLLNGGSVGDAFKSGLIGGIIGGVTGGLLGAIGDAGRSGLISNWFERGLAHGAVQGAAAEATGGEFRHGFYSGFAVGATEARIGKWAKGSEAKGIAAAAVVGGTASALGGGKFANGAVSGTFSFLFNYLSVKGPKWFEARVKTELDRIKSADPELKKMVETLDASPNEHVIRAPSILDAPDQRNNRARYVKLDANDSELLWFANDWNGPGGRRDPVISLVHELRHVYDIDRGAHRWDWFWRSNGPTGADRAEEWAIRTENIMRAKLPNHTIRNDYSGIPVFNPTFHPQF